MEFILPSRGIRDAAKPPARDSKSTEQILFVDDDQNLLESFTRNLHNEFTIETAAGGKEGLAAIHLFGPFAVVISDMRMPGLDGVEFLTRVRELSPQSVRILFTGHKDLKRAIAAVNEGQIFHYMTKPCSEEEMVSAIRLGLAQYHENVEAAELIKEAQKTGSAPSTSLPDNTPIMDAISRGLTMRRAHMPLLYLMAVFGISAGITLPAQAPQANTKPAEAQFFKLEPVRQLRKGVDAWPLILNAKDAPSKRVNAILQEMNQKLALALKECDTNYAAWAQEVGDASKGKGGAADDWERKVEVTMAGPRFVSVVATDTFIFCGGAYPDSDRIAMVFDMSTGDPVDWTVMIAKAASASSLVDSGYDGTNFVVLLLPGLEKINLAAASPECRDAFDYQQMFVIWPDAQKEALIAIASGLPHVVSGCEQEIHLTMEQVRSLGFNETIIDSIELAHGQSVAAPRP